MIDIDSRLTPFIELLEDHGVYNFRIIKKEITPPNGINPFDDDDDDDEVIPPEGLNQMENPFDDDDEVIPPEGFDRMENPFDDDDEVIPPEGFDQMENPFDDDDPPEGLDQMENPFDDDDPPEGFDRMENPFDDDSPDDFDKEYEYYVAYTDYKDSTGQRIFKILNLKELISLITKDLLVIRGHLDLNLSNFSSFLEEIVER